MSLTFFVAIFLILSTTATQISVMFDNLGDVFIDGFIRSLYDSMPIRFRLDLVYTFSRMRPTTAYGESLGGMRNHELPITLVSTNSTIGFPAEIFWASSINRINTIGIGQKSSMVQYFGSVDFVYTSNTTAVLHLGNEYENFTHHFCQPESIMSISTDVLGYALGYIGVNSTVISISFDRLPYTRVDLPEGQFFSILNRIRQTSSRIVQEPSETQNMVFKSCGHVGQILDPIHINFVNAEGHLVVEVSDFIQPIGSDDTCQLLIGNTGIEEIVVVDILRMKINTRFMRDQVSLCDSISF